MSLEPRLSITLADVRRRRSGQLGPLRSTSARAADAAGRRPARRVRPRGVRREPRGVRASGARWLGGRQATHRARRSLARAAHRAHLRRRRSPTRSGSAPTSCSPRSAARSCWRRRRRRSTCSPADGSTSASASVGSARSTTPPVSTSTAAARCSTRRWRSARRCGASSARRSTATRCSFDGDPPDAEARASRVACPSGSAAPSTPRCSGAWPGSGAAGSRGAASAERPRRPRSRRCARGLEEQGRDPSDLRIVGYLPVVRGDDGKPDLERSMDARPAARRHRRHRLPRPGCRSPTGSTPRPSTCRRSSTRSAPPSAGRSRALRR